MKIWLAKRPALFRAFLFEDAGIGRQIGGVERAFPEYLAELVRQLDRRDIGVIESAAAEQRGKPHITKKPCQTGNDRPAADREDIAIHARHPARLAGSALRGKEAKQTRGLTDRRLNCRSRASLAAGRSLLYTRPVQNPPRKRLIKGSLPWPSSPTPSPASSPPPPSR